MNQLPILGISMGDPFGNGPEITVKALADRAVYDRCRPLVVGDVSCMEYAAQTAKAVSGIDMKVRRITSVSEAAFAYGTIDVYDLGLVKPQDIPGDPAHPAPFGLGATALGGEAAFQYVRTVIQLAMEGQIDATITNALSKEAINMAGHHYSGHTEIYADYTHTSKYTMMLAHEDLRVVHVSTHVSLRQACDLVKKERVLDVIRIADAGCKAIGIKHPKIGVAGLNPHCGENGMFGTEEIQEIQPAIDAALAEGINIPEKKPTPPDTVFSKAIGGWYDIVVCMYHDQGHIPLKVKGFVYITVKVTRNIGYKINSQPEWVKQTGKANSGNVDTYTFTAEANTSTEAREGVIVFCNDNNGCIQVTVKQAGAKASLSVSPAELTFTAKPESKSFSVSSNTDWSVASSADWVKIGTTSGSGNAHVTASAEENTATTQRTATITLKTTDGKATATIKVTQNPADVVFSIDIKEFSIDAKGEEITIKIKHNSAYSVKSMPDWVNQTNKTVSGDTDNISFAVQHNPGYKRQGEIIFNGDGIYGTVTIKQFGSKADGGNDDTTTGGKITLE